MISSDRYSVALTVNGADEVQGFCGFQPDDLCSADELYEWFRPNVPIGATVSWVFRRESVEERGFLPQGDTTFTHGLIIKARCLYNPNVGPEPTCERTL